MAEVARSFEYSLFTNAAAISDRVSEEARAKFSGTTYFAEEAGSLHINI